MTPRKSKAAKKRTVKVVEDMKVGPPASAAPKRKKVTAAEIFAKEGVHLGSVEKALSLDAQRVGAAWFGMMPMSPGKGQLTFHMIECRPTARAQAGLDELVEAGLISVEPFNQYGGFVYKPIWNFEPLGEKWMRKVLAGNAGDPLPLIEKITLPPSPAKGRHNRKPKRKA